MKRLGSIRRFGVPALAGSAAIVVAALHVIYVQRTVQPEHDALSEQVQVVEKSLRGGRLAAGDDPPASPADQLQAFHASFPEVETSTEMLRRIHAAAQEQGLDLASGEYRIERRPGHALARYVVTLPLTGTYKELRAFMAAVLSDVPTVAIDDIQLRRESSASPKIEARVRLSLYLRVK